MYFLSGSDDKGALWDRCGEETFNEKYFQELAICLYGPGAAGRDLSGLSVMIVAAVHKDFLDPVPIDQNDPRTKSAGSQLLYFSLSKVGVYYSQEKSRLYSKTV